MSAKTCLETNRSDVLSGFHESARDFCREAVLTFDRDGMRMYGRDSAKVVLVQYFLPSKLIAKEGQGKYDTDEDAGPIEIGINTKIVANCLGGVSCGDIVGFSLDLDDDPDRLSIRCQNDVTGKKSHYRVITPDKKAIFPEGPLHVDIESKGYNSPITVSSQLFHDMLRDLTKSDAISLRVCCDGNRLVISAPGRHVRAMFEIRASDSTSGFAYAPKQGDRWPVCECFPMNYLQKVAKAKNLSRDVSLYLMPDFPIAISYKTDIGTISYMIAPREDEEWAENPASKSMPPPSSDIVGIESRPRNACTAVKRDEKPKKKDEQIESDEEEEEDGRQKKRRRVN